MKKNIVLLFFFLFALHIVAGAQTTISLGTFAGSGSTNVLLSTSTTTNRYSRTISVYTAAEMIAAGGIAGNITSLAWDKSGTGEYTTGNAYIKVYLKHVTNSAWGTSPVPDWNTEVTGATEVYTSSTYSIPTGTGWKQVTFSSNFPWNGTDNVAVFVEWDRASAPTGSINWSYSSASNANACRVGSTSLAALVMLVNSNRPLIQFTLNGTPPVTVTSVDAFTFNNVAATITTNGGTLQMDSDVLPAAASQAVTWSIVPVTGTATISTAGLVTAQTNGTVWAKAVSVQDITKKDSVLVTISNQVVPVTSVDAFTFNNVAATITTNGGTLQMDSDVLPAAASQAVTWSIVPATGSATISTAGLVTAQTNGTVWAKAVSVQDITKKDSVLVTISNQVVPVTSVDAFTFNNVAATITTNGGTLQMDADVLPAAASQAVTWSIAPVTGAATISTAGLVTAQSNGTVWAKAVSVQDITQKDSVLVTISNQVIPVTGIDVFTLNNAPAVITATGGTLQMDADVLPATANQAVTWSIVNVSGTATISSTGLITALTNGSVWAKGVSVQDPTKSDSIRIVIDQSVGISPVAQQIGFSLYPNPVTTGSLTLSVSNTYFNKATRIDIMDITGKLQHAYTMTSNPYTIPVNTLAPGMHLLRYYDSGNHLNTKFIVK